MVKVRLATLGIQIAFGLVECAFGLLILLASMWGKNERQSIAARSSKLVAMKRLPTVLLSNACLCLKLSAAAPLPSGTQAWRVGVDGRIPLFGEKVGAK